MKGAMRKICVECGEQMTLKTISRTFNIKGKEIEIRGIEAYVCEECGEIVYTSAEAKMIEKVIGAVNESAQEEVSALNLTEIQQKISDFLYENLGYMYCDNCRFNSEISEEESEELYGYWGCEDCHRKYNGWGISRETCDRLARNIGELI